MAEEWITITADQVFADNSKEKAGIVVVKGRDDLGETLEGVVNLFRDAIAARGRTLGDAGTVPSAYRRYVINLALWDFISTGVPRNDGIHTKERETAAKEAGEFLKSLREGNADPAGNPSFCRPRRKFTECDEDGI